PEFVIARVGGGLVTLDVVDCRLAIDKRAGELWYTYAAGYNRELNLAINALLREKKSISPEQINTFYDTFLSPLRHAVRIGEVGASISDEVGGVLQMIDEASGSVSDYGQSLETAQSKLDGAGNQAQIKAVIETVMSATHDMRSKNHDLERQLVESRNQIVELQSSLESIRFESLTDELTGLANRRHFSDSLDHLIAEARDGNTSLSLVMCDIDHFKRFNDTFGHQTGDQVLKLVSAAIKNNVKGQDVAARYGGEEFAIILPMTALNNAATVAEHIRVAIQSKELVKRSTGENLGHVTMSFGVALLHDSDTAETLIERADTCLYASKRSGRNRVTLETDNVATETQAVA
ncbi:MAG: GGDEF domain-containing protein, partial [Pseudomonadota bacterium]